ncbi:speckle-type POZ protein B-like isoform X20 [Planococcus citri]|uniref:speckle-type POZ protein B-like isoform X20 n=1 Tax=Planococcus citri TaxID=170843 RepID=UPI0031F753CC
MSSSLRGSVCKSNRCKTKIRSDTASYVWTIEDFHFHEAKRERLVSPVFSSVTNNQVKWYLVLRPNGKNDANDSISLFLHLSRLTCIEGNKNIFAEIAFYVLNNESREENRYKMSIKEFPFSNRNSKGYGFTKFIEKDSRFRNKMLSNNALTIGCVVKFSDMKDSSSLHQCDFDIEMPECDLSENFASLFENQELTDVILSVNGKEYPAHKAVLAARSPVFCAMFKHSTKESELNRVDIEDINEAVVEGMLKYIYTGKCDDLDELAEGLLAAADKYDLGRLKIMCAKKLINGLSVENAANVLILADMHHHEDLKREATIFIAANFPQVLNTAAWQMLLTNPHLMNEVCQAVARK